MLKKIFLTLLLVFVFLAASVYIFRSNIKQYAITTILKSFPIPNVALANVNFDETAGKLKLEGVKVKSPKGFRSKHVLEADSVDMSINFVTKPELRLNINDIAIAKPVLYVERSPDGKWNILEYTNKDKLASGIDAELVEKRGRSGFMREAFADETEKKSHIVLPRKINISNGTVRLLDSFVTTGETHTIDFFPLKGTVSLDYLPDKGSYEKIRFSGSCNIDGIAGRAITGDLEVDPSRKNPTYTCKVNASNVPLSAVKPYLDRHSPFIVKQGSFNMVSSVNAVDGALEGEHTMELMDLQFEINPRKSNMPFLETNVQKLTLYLTNQRGNVVIDFRQKGTAGGKMNWSLGPIAKRAIGLMAIDTVIDIMGGPGGEGGGGTLPGNVPPEVIDILRGILQ